jgi:hypothetical protein
VSVDEHKHCTCCNTAAPLPLKLPARGDAMLLLRMELLRRELLPMLLPASVFDAVCTAASSRKFRLF